MATPLFTIPGRVEKEILRVLWDAQRPLTSVEVYGDLYGLYKAAGQTPPAANTLAVTLSRMVAHDLATITYTQGRGKGRGKGLYSPTRSRASVFLSAMESLCCALTGETFAAYVQRFQEGTDHA